MSSFSRSTFKSISSKIESTGRDDREMGKVELFELCETFPKVRNAQNALLIRITY